MVPHKELEPLRKKIDVINKKLLSLLSMRSGIANRIGHRKALLNLPVSDLKREAAILKSLQDANQGPLDSRAVRAIFSVIIRETKRIERKANREQIIKTSQTRSR